LYIPEPESEHNRASISTNANGSAIPLVKQLTGSINFKTHVAIRALMTFTFNCIGLKFEFIMYFSITTCELSRYRVCTGSSAIGTWFDIKDRSDINYLQFWVYGHLDPTR